MFTNSFKNATMIKEGDYLVIQTRSCSNVTYRKRYRITRYVGSDTTYKGYLVIYDDGYPRKLSEFFNVSDVIKTNDVIAEVNNAKSSTKTQLEKYKKVVDLLTKIETVETNKEQLKSENFESMYFQLKSGSYSFNLDSPAVRDIAAKVSEAFIDKQLSVYKEELERLGV